MKSIQTSGKTVEDAIKAGLKELECGPADVEIDVVDLGSPGLFGMFGRLARVKMTVKEKDPELSFDMASLKSIAASEKKMQEAKAEQKAAPKPEPKPVAAKPVPKPEPKPAPEAKPVAEVKPEPKQAPEVRPAAENKPAPQPRPAVKPAPRAEGAPRPEFKPTPKSAPREGGAPRPDSRPANRPPRAPQKPEPRLAKTEREPADEGEETLDAAAIAATDLPAVDPETLTGLAREAYDFLRPLTNMMGVPVEIRARESEGQVTVQMNGDTLGILIGRRGDTLDALQYLTSLKLNRGREEYVRVSLDTEHYRVKREAALQKLASRMAIRVRRTGGHVALEPMNPYERRVLHSALQNDPYVTTHSEGAEPFRRVIITLKK